MTASERAQRLVARHRLTTALLAVCDTTETAHACDNANAALLAYVARLEAVAAAARELKPQGICTNKGFLLRFLDDWQRLKDALAALDRPEDGETK